MSIDQRTYRNTLGCFATGITVVTSDKGNENPIGVTINSFASVSLEPPMVLFSLKTESQLCGVFEEAGKFNVNILNADQEAVSNLFAGSQENKFSNVAWEKGENGAPVLTESLASLECTLSTTYPGGDHTIFLGEVTKIHSKEDGSPLLYYRGGYRTL